MPLNDDVVLAKAPGLTWIRNKEGVVFERGFALNDAGAAMFLALDGARPLRAVCRALQEQYEVEYDELSGDLLGLAEELIEAGLIQVVTP
ncbi:MAG TPA: PqqD family protein [Kofleriaceae bacterium]|nr:PqqD family protein [Kofleriaceae bacterium]